MQADLLSLALSLRVQLASFRALALASLFVEYLTSSAWLGWRTLTPAALSHEDLRLLTDHRIAASASTMDGQRQRYRGNDCILDRLGLCFCKHWCGRLDGEDKGSPVAEAVTSVTVGARPCAHTLSLIEDILASLAAALQVIYKHPFLTAVILPLPVDQLEDVHTPAFSP